MALGTNPEKSAEQSPQAIEKMDVDNKAQQETLPPPETTKPSSGESHVYAQSGGLFKATKNVGTVKMNSTFEQGNTPKQAPTMPDGVTHLYVNDGPVVESETIQDLDFTAVYKNTNNPQ